MPKPIKPTPSPGPLGQLSTLARSAAHGVKSMLKTQVLRGDRLNAEAYQARLNVCRNCPGKHATFNKDGGLLRRSALAGR